MGSLSVPSTLPEELQADLRARAHVVTASRGGVGGVGLIGIDPKTKQATGVGPAAGKMESIPGKGYRRRCCDLLASLRWAFWIFFMAFRCFRADLLTDLLFCLAALRASRAFSPMRVFSLVGSDHAGVRESSSRNAAIRFMSSCANLQISYNG